MHSIADDKQNIDAPSKNTAPKRKSVLLVAYYFPPIGGGGVQRAFKMAKYLGEFDWDVHVLTVDPIHHVSLDPTLLEQLPPEVHIHRTQEIRLWNRRPKKAVEVANPAAANAAANAAADADADSAKAEANAEANANAAVKTEAHLNANAHAKPITPPKASILSKIKKSIISRLKKIKNTIMTPDDQILWVPYARRKGLEIIREHQIDVIFSTSGPHSAHLVGNYLKRKTGLPWIANFQDPWTQNNHRPNARWRRWIEDHMEARVMRESDCVVTVTHSFAKNFVDKYPNEIEHIEVIHNGFDRADYEHIVRRANWNVDGVSSGSEVDAGAGRDGVRDDVQDNVQGNDRRAHRDSAKWVLVYTGILYEKRNPRLLLKAIAELIEEGLIPRERIVLRFAGVFDYPGNDDNISCVYELGLQDIVEVLGHLPHRQSLQTLADADTLMLINDTHPGSGDYIPGKLFEYMAIGHPILALSLTGESTRIIEDHQLGEIADPTDLADIKRAVLKLYDKWLDSRSHEASPELLYAVSSDSDENSSGGPNVDETVNGTSIDGKTSAVSASEAQERQDAAEPPRTSSLIYERKEQARMLADLMNELTTPRI